MRKEGLGYRGMVVVECDGDGGVHACLARAYVVLFVSSFWRGWCGIMVGTFWARRFFALSLPLV